MTSASGSPHARRARLLDLMARGHGAAAARSGRDLAQAVQQADRARALCDRMQALRPAAPQGVLAAWDLAARQDLADRLLGAVARQEAVIAGALAEAEAARARLTCFEARRSACAAAAEDARDAARAEADQRAEALRPARRIGATD
ncbi:hypothetical protein [Frigidibacter oleivorans]|uniref:hypothetical protein n=1 Tax=Frigidibacter oleivorans TaxID=2487129 RepID=UPI000F8E160C|nr:hypothetical protein [Frigidibacter oleivorans]